MKPIGPTTPSSDATALTDGARGTTGGSVLRSGVWATTSRILPQLSSLLVSIVAAHALGSEGMGRQSLIAFAAIFGTTVATLGLPTALTRFIGETVGAGRPETLRPLVRAAWKIEAVAAAVGGATLVGIGLAGGQPRAAWILTGAVCLLSVLQKVAAGVLVGLQHWREASAISLLVGAAGTVATIVVLWLGGGITGMFAVGAAVTLVTLVWTARVARRRIAEIAPVARRDPDLHRRTWRYAIIASLGVPVTLIVWFRSEFFFLQHYSSDKQIALYSIAFSASAAIVLLPQTVANVLAPAFATLFGAGTIDRIRSGFSRALRLLMTVTLPLTAAAIALGPAFLRLVYGSAYAGTSPVFLIMVVGLPLIPMLQLSTSVLFGLGHQWVPLFVGIVAAVLDLTVAAILVPGHGAIGAAIANLAGQVSLAVPLIVYAVRTVGDVSWAPAMLLRTAATAVISGTAAFAVVRFVGGGVGLVAGIAVDAVVLALLLRVVPVVSSSDADWLAQTVHPRLAVAVRWLRPAAPASAS